MLEKVKGRLGGSWTREPSQKVWGSYDLFSTSRDSQCFFHGFTGALEDFQGREIQTLNPIFGKNAKLRRGVVDGIGSHRSFSNWLPTI